MTCPKGTNMSLCFSLEMPHPVSRTDSWTNSLPGSLQGMAFSMTVMLPSVVNLAELPTRLYRICKQSIWLSYCGNQVVQDLQTWHLFLMLWQPGCTGSASMVFDSYTVRMCTEWFACRSCIAFSMTVKLPVVRNLAECTRLYKICKHHIKTEHNTTHHITSHHIISALRRRRTTLVWYVIKLSDGCLTELLHSCSRLGSNLTGTQQLLAKAAAERVLQYNCPTATILCETSNSTMSLPAWYQVFLACHLVSSIRHARAIGANFEHVAVLALTIGSFDKARVTLVMR